jgi:hypothetical protein
MRTLFEKTRSLAVRFSQRCGWRCGGGGRPAALQKRWTEARV